MFLFSSNYLYAPNVFDIPLKSASFVNNFYSTKIDTHNPPGNLELICKHILKFIYNMFVFSISPSFHHTIQKY